MTDFELWVKGCEINNTWLYCLAGGGDTGLYKLSKQYMVNNVYYRENPVYIGWVSGKQVCATLSYKEAHDIWESRKEYSE